MEGHIHIPNEQELPSSVSSETEMSAPAVPHAGTGNDEQRPLARDEKEQSYNGVQGRIVGGAYLQNLEEKEHHSLIKVEIDMPYTLTSIVHEAGVEYIILQFAPHDPENPFNWNIHKKRFITVLLCLMTLMIGLATTAYSSGIGNMCSDFGVSEELGQLGLFTFNFACAIAPLFLAPFCELVGRRVIYVGAYGGFVICFIGLALGKNIATIIVMRTLLGLFGCVGTILVGGTFSDMWEPDSRAIPMAMFSWVAILGTVAAPIYAGFIDETIGWRWIEGIQGLANLPLLALVTLFLRETRGGVTLHRRAKQLREATGDERYKASMDIENTDLKAMLHSSSVKAVHMLATEPVVFAFGLWISFAWFVTFLFLSVIPITFEEHHGWSEGIGKFVEIERSSSITSGACH